mgnify:CR=1 FL=1
MCLVFYITYKHFSQGLYIVKILFCVLSMTFYGEMVGVKEGEGSRNFGGHGHIFNKFPYFPPFFRMISSHFFEKCSRCAVPFSVDLPADCLNYHFYIVHDHTESEKKSRSKNIFSKFRKLFRKKYVFGKFRDFF